MFINLPRKGAPCFQDPHQSFELWHRKPPLALSSPLHWPDSSEAPRCCNALPGRRHDACTCKQSGRHMISIKVYRHFDRFVWWMWDYYKADRLTLKWWVRRRIPPRFLEWGSRPESLRWASGERGSKPGASKKKKQKIRWVKRAVKRRHLQIRSTITSSCPPQAAVCSTSLQYFSNSSGGTETVQICILTAGWQVYFVLWSTADGDLPVVNVSPVVGLLRKGRKFSGLLLMCSAVRDLSSLKVTFNPG